MTLVIYTWPRHGATKMAHLPIAMRQLIFFHIDGRLCLPYHTFYYSKYLQTTACVNSMVMAGAVQRNIWLKATSIGWVQQPWAHQFNITCGPTSSSFCSISCTTSSLAFWRETGEEIVIPDSQLPSMHSTTLISVVYKQMLPGDKKVWIRLHSSVVSKLYASSYVSRDLLKRHIQ